MKKLLLQVVALMILLSEFNPVKAQYVTIPDTAFVSWLNAYGYAGCMSGNQLDTTCITIAQTTHLEPSSVPIRDLTGIQYFKNITILDCSSDSLYYIPALPASITYFVCKWNNL